MPRALRSHHAGMAIVVLFWGGNFTASKLAFSSIPPLGFTAIRFIIGSVLLWYFLHRREAGLGTVPRPLFWRLVGMGVIGNTLYQLCFITGLARTSATNTSLILAAMPTVVTVAAGLSGLERISPRQRWALALATLGVILVIASRGLDLTHGDWVGDGLILGAVACWTAYTLELRRLTGAISTLRITTWTMLTGTPGLVLAGLPDLLSLQWSAITPAAWGGLAYSTLLSLVASYVLWNRAVQHLGAARASLYTCATPLVATAVAAVGLGERPTVAHVAGAGLIIGGVVLGNVGRLRRRAGIDD